MHVPKREARIGAARAMTEQGVPYGIIDPDYAGELLVIIQNEGQYPFAVQFGDKVAQLVVTQYFGATPKWTTFTHATARGAQGLGSTGK